MKFIFATDGTAINVRHIVTIFVANTSKGDGYVVRCTTTLQNGEFVVQGSMLSLSPVLGSKELAQAYLDAVVKDILNDKAKASA